MNDYSCCASGHAACIYCTWWPAQQQSLAQDNADVKPPRKSRPPVTRNVAMDRGEGKPQSGSLGTRGSAESKCPTFPEWMALEKTKIHINLDTLTNNSSLFSPSPFMNTGSSDSCTAGRKNSCHSVACFRNLSGREENRQWRVRHKWSPHPNNTTEEMETLEQVSTRNWKRKVSTL